MPNKVLTVVVPSNPIEVITIRVPGQQGPGGTPGPPGPSSVLSIGTVSSLAEGATATATLSGVSPTQTLNLGIPRGATGAAGPPSSLSVGTITTSAPGGNGAATITGTAPNYTLNLTLPRGYGVPSLGTANQVLVKNSSTDYDTGWMSHAVAATPSTIMSRDSSGDSSLRYLNLSGASPTLGQAISRGYLEGASSTEPGASTLVKRYPDGSASFNTVYAANAPGSASELTRKDYVDSVAGTPRRLIPANYPGGAGQPYIRLATLDGTNANGGADLEFILSGQGDIGTAARGTYMISFTQRGDNTTSVKAWSWGHDATQNKLALYTKQISTYKFELWGKFANYNNDQYMHVLSGSAYTLNIDSNTTTAPTGLSSAYTIYDYDTEMGPVRNATSATVASSIVKRDVNGWAQFAGLETSVAATQNQHVTRKDYVDSVTKTASQISDSTATGRSLIVATDAAAARSAIALGNVDNTSDINKPVSTAQSAAIGGAIVTAKQQPLSRNVSAAITFQAADANDIVMITNTTRASVMQFTIPTNATVSTPTGTWVDVCAPGVGTVVITPASGVTLRGDGRVYGNYGVSRILKVGTDEWVVINTFLPKDAFARCFAYADTGVSGWAAGFNYLPLNAESIDTHNGHPTGVISGSDVDTTTKQNRYTCQPGQAGEYLVSAMINITIGVTSVLHCRILKNNTWFRGCAGLITSSSISGTVLTGEKLVTLAEGDWVTAQHYSSNGNYNTDAGEQANGGATSWMSVNRIS